MSPLLTKTTTCRSISCLSNNLKTVSASQSHSLYHSLSSMFKYMHPNVQESEAGGQGRSFNTTFLCVSTSLCSSIVHQVPTGLLSLLQVCLVHRNLPKGWDIPPDPPPGSSPAGLKRLAILCSSLTLLQPEQKGTDN